MIVLIWLLLSCCCRSGRVESILKFGPEVIPWPRLQNTQQASTAKVAAADRQGNRYFQPGARGRHGLTYFRKTALPGNLRSIPGTRRRQYPSLKEATALVDRAPPVGLTSRKFLHR